MQLDFVTDIDSANFVNTESTEKPRFEGDLKPVFVVIHSQLRNEVVHSPRIRLVASSPGVAVS